MIVSFTVAIDLYWVIWFGHFLINPVTLLYVTVPVDETVSQEKNVSYGTMDKYVEAKRITS